jgi:hypothetical protein
LLWLLHAARFPKLNWKRQPRPNGTAVSFGVCPGESSQVESRRLTLASLYCIIHNKCIEMWKSVWSLSILLIIDNKIDSIHLIFLLFCFYLRNIIYTVVVLSAVWTCHL